MQKDDCTSKIGFARVLALGLGIIAGLVGYNVLGLNYGYHMTLEPQLFVLKHLIPQFLMDFVSDHYCNTSSHYFSPSIIIFPLGHYFYTTLALHLPSPTLCTHLSSPLTAIGNTPVERHLHLHTTHYTHTQFSPRHFLWRFLTIPLTFPSFLLYFQHDLNLLNICMKPFIHVLISFVHIGKWVADTERVSYLPETRFSTILIKIIQKNVLITL